MGEYTEEEVQEMLDTDYAHLECKLASILGRGRTNYPETNDFPDMETNLFEDGNDDVDQNANQMDVYESVQDEEVAFGQVYADDKI